MRSITIPKHIPYYLLRPLRLFKEYDRVNIRADFVAGLTVAVILLPQAIAFAIIADLPPEMGLYGAIVGAVIGALWGSSNQIHMGPTNAISLLVLSALSSATAVSATSGEIPNLVIMAGLMAVMVGLFQLVLGIARLGLLVNFVSHSVIVGFASGAGVLIAVKQLRPLLGLEFESHNLWQTFLGIVQNIAESHPSTTVIGIGAMILIIILRRINPKLPGALIGMIIASTVVGFLGLDQQGVATIGQLPANLPPLADLPLLNLDLFARISTGALAVAAIGLVETAAISRSIATQTGQRLDSNQEFVGQGLSNIFVGFFSGYPCAGSFSRSAVNFKAGAKSPIAALLSGIFVLIGMFTLAPFAKFLPKAALAGVLIVTAYGMIDRAEMKRIWQGSRFDAIIMMVTFLGTLFLHIEFAVLMGILLSFGFYIMQTSACQVQTVLPDKEFKHFVHQSEKRDCPQLGIISISGDLYFGAVTHIEEEILTNLDKNPDQRFLLLRMHNVNQCDFSGIHMLEHLVHVYRERGGDIFFVRVSEPVLEIMHTTGFYEHLGKDHFLIEDEAISRLFYRVLDPAVCIYECPIKVFKECQNLPKEAYVFDVPLKDVGFQDGITKVKPRSLWEKIHEEKRPFLIDVREPREFRQGHIDGAELVPLKGLLSGEVTLPIEQEIIAICRSGRRSHRAAAFLRDEGYKNIAMLEGGMLAWEAALLLEAVEI